MRALTLAICWITCLCGSNPCSAANSVVPVGAAKMDITPSGPIRLTGYGNRRTESAKAAQKIWAKALAIGADGGDGPAVLITVENCGMTPAIRDAVAKQLSETAKVRSERLAVTVSHSHTAPCLTDWAPYIFGEDIPDDQQRRIDKYTGELIGKMVQVAIEALANRRPAQLAWTQGTVPFAANRRVLKNSKWAGFGNQPDGPVDHSLPILVARETGGKLLAVVANYACHCTTLTGSFNQISGDWSGFAQDYIENDHPGAVALITIGCGADANPEPRGEVEHAQQHGRAMADEVARLLKADLKPINPNLSCKLRKIDLPFDKLPTREQWEAKTKEQRRATAYHARKFLERLDAGEKLPTTVSYPVATWTFGDDLAVVFLGGEVVVDYAIRLKDEFDAKRLWITAYANDVPCYIASRRVLREGGYEVDGSMIYYARPTRLAPAVENLIVDSVKELLPPGFESGP